jgi:hypothetical protein
VLAGTQLGHIYRTDIGLTSNASTTWTSVTLRNYGDYISWVTTDPGNANIAYATVSSFNYQINDHHVYKSTDGGVSWIGIDGSGSTGIPDIPVNCIVVDPNNSSKLYVGTDLGVFVSLDGGAMWNRENTGFANAVTESLSFNTVGGATSLFAFTHGRGVWRVAVSTPGCTEPVASPPSLPPGDTVYVEDQLPTGAVPQGTWVWDTVQKASGSQSNTEPAAPGIHQHYFNAATQTLSVNAGDKLVCYVLLSTCSPPQELMLQWSDTVSGFTHRAFWGADLIPWGTTGTADRYPMGALPPVGQWVRLEVPASSVNLQGQVLNGMAFTLYDGQAWFDRAGKSTGSSVINVALAANGGVASASSTYSASFPTSAVNNGDRKGLNWGNGGGWNDGTANIYPDWIQIDFSGSKTITEIDVFTLQDNFSNPADPTLTMTFTQYGITDFNVQYWNGSAWVTVTAGAVTGNNKVWRQFTFSSITTAKIRVLINSALASHSRVTEIEAY